MNDKKNILLVHRFFYPDSPPYAVILDDMREILKAEGYHVDVLSSQPSYKNVDFKKNEKFISIHDDGSKTYRLPVFKFKNKKIRNLFNFIWFPTVVFFFLLFKRRYDVMTVATTPPVVLAFVVAVIAKIKKVALIYHFMDIHPEIGNISGEFKNKYIYHLLKRMDLFSCKVASKIIVLSEDMKNSLLNRNKQLSDKIEIINNYDVNSKKIFDKDYFQDKTKKRIVYTGNIGKFQGLEVFIESLKAKKEIDNFELVFVGEGNRLEKLKKLSSSISNIKFIPHVSIEKARKIISEADMGIVSLEKKIINYAYPSKVMTYLSEGTPILVVADNGSELESFINENNLGIFVEYNDSEKIYDIYKNITSNNINFDREKIKKVFNKNFSKNIFKKKLISIFKDI
ncbi:glycosyltransferase family 4 protein [Sulfurimonas sp.]|uniref:glycosyltransferase family 4 protein n=1 Tax=Sulfurimonas sp. TaxID=2022749 RepID=UPI0035666CCD